MKRNLYLIRRRVRGRMRVRAGVRVRVEAQLVPPRLLECPLLGHLVRG